MPECVQDQTGVNHCNPTEEVTLWRHQQAFEQEVLKQDLKWGGQGWQEETQFPQEQVTPYLPTPEGMHAPLYSVYCNFVVS